MNTCSEARTKSGSGHLTMSVNEKGWEQDYSSENGVLTLRNSQGMELKYNRRAASER